MYLYARGGSGDVGVLLDGGYVGLSGAECSAVSGGSEHFGPFRGTSGDQLDDTCSGLYATVEPFMSEETLGGLNVVLTDTMVENGLPGFVHAVLTDLAVWRQQLLKQGLYPENCRRVRCVADVTAEAWLNALPVASNCLWGDGDVVSSLR